ncbi:type II secretion system secretin GspD [Bradyrhizobium sp. WD16]|uniref:type II secretion system secretin GspD n=1 Tax=Bradyrhizobium sp. WD16 TaxID=1521768 RepID=UPI0020A4AAFB|nr:type II secretion system secretin GspD [Bradyrhizobium sp. WD16]UTD28125.1 type II secretion system protein GspD [Bradyrhizobium sp. WD16]
MRSVGSRGQSPTAVRKLRAVVVLALSVNLLASCGSAGVSGIYTSDVDVLDKVRSLDILPRKPQSAGLSQTGTGERGQPAVYEGTVVSDVPEVRPQPTSNGPGYDLNFENTPVATVAKVVLGDILRTGYTIDPRVQGTVSLVSVRPVAKSDIVFVLENALRLSGVVLVRDTAGYRLTPLGDAVGAGRVDSAAASPEPGYGVSVVPLQYVSAQTVLKLLDSFATKAGSVRADSTRNLLLIQGTGAERQAAVDTAMSFDVDWMRGQSVGIFPVSSSGPEPIIAELEKIMDSGDSGLSHNVVKFQPVGRLNAILVVSRKPALLQTAATWIKRLDRADTARNGVHVYQVKYGEARQIARVLNEMFVGSSGSSSLDSPDNQLAPGSGTSTSSSTDRLSLNANSASTSNGFGPRGQSGAGSNATSGLGSAQSATASTTANANGSGTGAVDSRSSGNGQPLLQNVRITPDTVNNTLLIYADQQNYRIIENTLRQVDQPQLQVAIDATIAEVTLTNELSYGVQTYLTSRNLGLKANSGSVLNTQATTAPATTTDAATGVASIAGSVTNAFINRAFPGFNFLIGSETQPSVILDALHAVTSVKVLSNPSLVVINNQSATLQVGDVVPVSTGSATVLTTNNTVVNTIDYRNTGIILRVSPRINVNGNVRLEVEQEISNVSPATAASLTPTVSERRVKSSISVATGQTVLLAGLISEQQNGARNGIPLLDQIPGLGDGFTHQDKKGTRTELIIFIRPQIIRDGSDAHLVAEELRTKLRGNVGASVTNDLRVPTVR